MDDGDSEVADPGKRKAFREAANIAVPMVVGAAVVSSEPKKVSGLVGAAGGLLDRLRGRKNEVAQQMGNAAGQVGETINIALLNDEQRQALEMLNKPGIPKSDFVVDSNVELVSEHGLAYRKTPHIPAPTEEPGIIDRLQPGEIIAGGVFWESKKPEFTSTADMNKGPNWIAFKRGNDVGFSYAGYLKKVDPATAKNNSEN